MKCDRLKSAALYGLLATLIIAYVMHGLHAVKIFYGVTQKVYS